LFDLILFQNYFLISQGSFEKKKNTQVSMASISPTSSTSVLHKGHLHNLPAIAAYPQHLIDFPIPVVAFVGMKVFAFFFLC